MSLNLNYLKAIVTREVAVPKDTAWTELNVRPWGSWRKRSEKSGVKETSFPVTPLKFRKLREKSDGENSGSSSSRSNSEHVQSHVLSGVVNDAFMDDSEVFEKTEDVVKGPLKKLIVTEDRALDFNNSKESTMI